jgi:bacillolysin
MSAKLSKTRRRWGCLARLLVIVLSMGACYWLLLAPLPKPDTTQPDTNMTPQPTVENVRVDGEISPAQQAALEKLANDSKEGVEVLAQNGQVQYLTVHVEVPDSVGGSAQEKASYFLQQNKSFFEVQDPRTQLKVKERTVSETGANFIRYEQEYQGIPIYGSEAIVEVQQRDITSVTAAYSPDLEINVQPALRSLQAEEIALNALDDPNGQILSPTRLVIYDANLFGESSTTIPKLAWDVIVGSTVDIRIVSYLVDAQMGTILLSLEEVIGLQERNIWDAQSYVINPKDNLFWVWSLSDSSKQVMNEDGAINQSNPDDDAERAWVHAGTVYDYYYDHFHRDSFDGKGGAMELYINLGNSNNAFWSPLFQKGFFADGVTSLDVIAHELTHGVWHSRRIRMFYKGEAAALTESYGDIFAAFIDDIDPWRITADDPTHTNPAKKLFRDISKPAKTNYSQYDKNGDHYRNSMIHSYAVYLLSEGSANAQLPNQIEVRGIGRAKAQYIFYDVMTNRLIVGVNFKNARKVTIAACKELIGLHGITPSDCDQVINAYAAIGIGEAATEPSPPLLTIPQNLDPYTWLRGLRQSVNDFLGPWSPTVLWEPFQHRIDELRNNEWVQLLQCFAESDQQCINQFAAELMLGILNLVWAVLLAIILWILDLLYQQLIAMQNTCATLFILPILGFLLHARRARKL